MREPLTVGSLFSGLGSFDHGLELAGCRTIWQVEIEPACVAVLARHWPEVVRYGDITQVDPATLPVPDIIVGGFPCQDLSVAGNRKGLAGERSGLWYEFHRILRGCHSRWVIVENVDGLLSSNHGEGHAIVLGGLTGVLPRVPADGWQSGGFARGPFYNVAWRVLDAEYFGVAQRRNRVFFVGNSRNGSAAEVLFEPEGLPWDPPARRETGKEATVAVAASLTSGGSNPGGRRKEDDINLVPSVVGALSTGEGTHGYRYAGDDAAQGHFIPSIVGALVGAGGSHGYSLTGDRAAAGHFIPSVARPLRAQAQLAHREDADTLVAGSLTARYGKGADTTASDPLVYQRQGTNVGEIGALRRGNGHVTGGVPFVAHALTSEGADASEDGTGRGIPLIVEPEWAVRRLTPRECEKLQGLPPDWSRWGATGKEISDSARYRMIGNAGASPILTWIGRRIIASLS